MHALILTHYCFNFSDQHMGTPICVHPTVFCFSAFLISIFSMILTWAKIIYDPMEIIQMRSSELLLVCMSTC